MEEINLAIFILATDDETLTATYDSVKDIDAKFYVITNGYETEFKNNAKFSSFNDIREAYNYAVKECITFNYDALLIRSGATLSNIDALLEASKTYSMITATMLDSNNTEQELTGNTNSAFPIPEYAKIARTTGTTETIWLEGPVIYISNKVMWNNGMFDTTLSEHFIMVDYAIQARWSGFKLAISHDAYAMYLNNKAFTSIFNDNELQHFKVGQHLFQKKYGGSILNTLIGK